MKANKNSEERIIGAQRDVDHRSKVDGVCSRLGASRSQSAARASLPPGVKVSPEAGQPYGVEGLIRRDSPEGASNSNRVSPASLSGDEEGIHPPGGSDLRPVGRNGQDARLASPAMPSLTRRQLLVGASATLAAGAPRFASAADEAIIKDGVTPANVGIASIIAIGSTKARTVSARFADTVNVLDFGADPTGVADSAAAIQAALATGRSIDFGDARSKYRISSPLYGTTSGQRLIGRGATIACSGVATSAIIIGYTGSAFAKTDDVVIDGLNFMGEADGTSPNPAAIKVWAPAADPHVEGRGCSRLAIRNVRASGFCFGLVATGANDVTVTGCRFGGNFYVPGVSAGGYGVLLQTCWDVKVSDNAFVASPDATDRHAIYISADPTHKIGTANTCKRVIIANNVINWLAVANTGLGHEVAVAIRSASDCVVSGNVIVGGFGAITYSDANGNGENVAITGNTVRDQVARASEKASILLLHDTEHAAFVTRNVTIAGNTIGPFASHVASVTGLQLWGVDGVTVLGNAISGDFRAMVYFVDPVTNVQVSDNYLRSGGGSAFDFLKRAARPGTIVIGRNHVVGARIFEKFTDGGAPVSLVHDFPRSVKVQARGPADAKPVVVSDPWGLVSSVAAHANGIAVTFGDATTGTNWSDVAITSLGAGVGQVYVRSAGPSMVVGVLDVAGPLHDMPAATNSYYLVITVGS